MKIKYFIIIGMIILTIIGGYCLIGLLNDKDDHKSTIKEWDYSKIKSFYITYSNGYAMNSYTIYQLIYHEGIYTVNIKPHGVSEENTLEIDVDSTIMDKLVNILKKYNVGNWNNFHKNDKNVLDGDSFSLSIGFQDNKSISASGYMMWPENYKNVIDEVSPLFMEIYNNAKEIRKDE